MTENSAGAGRREPAGDTASTSAEDSVATLASELIRIDTSNTGDNSGPGERTAAEYVATILADAGLESQIIESHPKRASVIARISGTDSSRPALLIHGHLDVVPADAGDWRVHLDSWRLERSAQGCGDGARRAGAGRGGCRPRR